jgi:hypothetical protein
MNDTSKTQKYTNTSQDIIYDAGFDVIPEVTRITADTFSKKGSGLAGQIAYLDNGAKLYQAFKDAHSHTDENGNEEISDPARLISVHKSALREAIADAERLIIIGGGSYSSIMSQELSLVRAVFEADHKAPLKEIIIVDTSPEFLAEDIHAVRDFEEKLNSDLNINVHFDVTGLRGNFRKIAGETFDDILQRLGKLKRDEIKSALITTGATFGNLENVGSTDSVPENDVDVQMATLGEFVNVGDTVMFDHFTMMRNGEGYYNHPALAKFFTNIPVIMRDHCKNLIDFNVNDVNGNPDDIYFSYRAKNLWKARLVAHQLIAELPQTSTISNGIDRVLTINGEYNVMYSFRPTADIIINRPSANTGLESNFYVSSKDLVMHVCNKVQSHVSALKPDEPIQQSVTSASMSSNNIVMAAGLSGLAKRAITYTNLPQFSMAGAVHP